ncbi:MAG TPA: MarC family protein [Rhabdochlamydiaceae bacterium]|nr:MarC family protein [Rhabdochlamydiaceae bacterium]
MKIYQIVNYFISLLVICSPLSALPALLSMTHGQSLGEKRQTGIVAGFAVGVILVVVTWIGGPVLNVLGISVHAFQIAGGFIILMLAFSMLKAEQSRIKQATEDQKEANIKESVAVVPLAIPIMAGPGAISTVIVAVSEYPGFLNQVFLMFSGILVAIVLGIVLYFASSIEKVLGHTGINIVNRIGGLILAAMAIESIAHGALVLFPGLGKPG